MSGHDDAGLVLEHINLLERTSPLLASEAAFPERQPSGLGSSVLKTLLYLTQHYYAAPENLLHSPSALVKMHRKQKFLECLPKMFNGLKTTFLYPSRKGKNVLGFLLRWLHV